MDGGCQPSSSVLLQSACLGLASAARELTQRPGQHSRLAAASLLAQRAAAAAAAVSCSHLLAEGTRRWLQRPPPTSRLLVQTEWTAALATGGASVAGGLWALQRVGVQHHLRAASFLLLPAAQIALDTRESLVLWRASQPLAHDAAVGALAGALPLLLLPPPLRVWLVPKTCGPELHW